MGLAHRGLNDLENAFRCLDEAVARFERDRILMDWILRIPLHYALSLCWLSRGDAMEARRQAYALSELARSREKEPTWRSHILRSQNPKFWSNTRRTHLNKSSSPAPLIGGAKVPLAEWRISATAAKVCGQQGQAEEAALHQNRALDVLNELARSLDETDRLRHSLLSSAVMKSLTAIDKAGASAATSNFYFQSALNRYSFRSVAALRLRNREGGVPNSRLNARLNAASEP
jgi:hypothetical protein